MWRYIFLAIIAFTAGVLHSAFLLDLQIHWQIPAVVGLAVFLAMHTMPRPRLKPQQPKRRAKGSHQILKSRLNVEFIEGGANVGVSREKGPIGPPQGQPESSIHLQQ